MGFSQKLNKPLKKILIGRDIQLIDKLVFAITNGNSSGWVIGNKLRNLAYGKKRAISKEPFIFIGGFPRSGTTLLQNFLDQYKEIITTEIEVNVLQDIKSEKTLKERTKKGKREKGFMFNDKEIRELDLGEDIIEDAEKIAEKAKDKYRGKRVLLKQPKHVFFLKDIFKHFTNSKFIHVIRDGRDATMSQRYYCLQENQKEHPYEWCCRQWVTAIKRGRKFRENPRYIEVYYENLIKNPEKELQRILDFLGLEKKAQIKYTKKNGKNFPNHPNVGKPLDKSVIGKGKRKMTKKDKKIFNKIARKELIKLGYVKDNNR